MVAADVERGLGNVRRLLQHAVAVFRMLADFAEFVVGKFALLVEDGIRNFHLAEIVQQPGQAELPHFGIALPYMSGEIGHQRAHRDRVHVGVFVLLFEAQHFEQCPRITLDHLDYVINHGGHFGHTDCATETDIGEGAAQHAHRSRDEGRGALFVGILTSAFEIAPSPRRWRPLHAAHYDWCRRRGGCNLHADPPIGIDDYVGHARLVHAQHISLRGQHELHAPKRMIEPGAAKAADVHAQPDLLWCYFNQHPVLPRYKSASPILVVLIAH